MYEVSYSIPTKIVGVTHFNADGRSRQEIIKTKVKPGMRLRFIREPYNPYDRNAISVWISGGEQLGYLSRWRAEDFVHFIDKGTLILTGTVTEVTGGGFLFKRNYGVNIMLDIIELDRPTSLPLLKKRKD